MLGKYIYKCAYVPPNAVILLVDLEEQYLDRQEMGQLPAQDQAAAIVVIRQRLQKMRERLLMLKAQGHRIYATVETELIGDFRGIPDAVFPPWPYFLPGRAGRQIHPQIAAGLRQELLVLVGGLWLERCVLSVTCLLKKAGIRALVATAKDLSLEVALIGDHWNLAQEAVRRRLVIREYLPPVGDRSA
ncbi:MAG: hypothetical protein PHU78_09630 [Heliobacteriaceae bacterium]|nr:hypothetical protein [Heliobacteriaceae bacterium]